MADSDSAPWLSRPAAQAVADSTGGTTVTVHCGAWATVAPTLSPETAAMLAPPVMVSSSPVDVPAPVSSERRRAELLRYRTNMPSMPAGSQHGRHRRSHAG
jgi:hypothetical protein